MGLHTIVLVGVTTINIATIHVLITSSINKFSFARKIKFVIGRMIDEMSSDASKSVCYLYHLTISVRIEKVIIIASWKLIKNKQKIFTCFDLICIKLIRGSPTKPLLFYLTVAFSFYRGIQNPPPFERMDFWSDLFLL